MSFIINGDVVYKVLFNRGITPRSWPAPCFPLNGFLYEWEAVI